MGWYSKNRSAPRQSSLRVVFVAALVTSAPIATAAERGSKECELDTLAFVPAYTENSALTAECRVNNGRDTRICRFVELSLSVPSESELRKQLQEARAEMVKMPAGDVSRMAADVRGVCRKAGDESGRAAMRTAIEANKTQEKKRSVQVAAARLESLCKCQTEQCIQQELLAQREKDLRVCKVRSQTFELEFRRTSPNRWVSTDGPKGQCEVIEVTSVELESETCLPTVTWVRASANKSAPGPICKGLEVNLPTTWSWRAERKMATTCDIIEFGF